MFERVELFHLFCLAPSVAMSAMAYMWEEHALTRTIVPIILTGMFHKEIENEKTVDSFMAGIETKVYFENA